MRQLRNYCIDQYLTWDDRDNDLNAMNDVMSPLGTKANSTPNFQSIHFKCKEAEG